MKKAHIKAFFIKNIYYETSKDIQFKINDLSYSTNDEFANIELAFNELESEIGKKVCSYEIIEKNIQIKCKGLVEVYPGFSNAYIFLDNKGTTCEFIFLRGIEEIKNFMKNKFEITLPFDKKIPVILNQLDTLDRANLIVINCPININIKINEKILLNFGKISDKICNFSSDNSYVVCFHKDDYKEIEYRRIRLCEEFNFNQTFVNNKEKAFKIYQTLNNAINGENNDLDEIFNKLYDSTLQSIFSQKLIFPKSILEKELNKEEYLDFFYNLFYFFYLYKIKNVQNIKDMAIKLDKNYKIIKNDQDINIYEKILLIKNIYSDLDLLGKEDIINYYKIDKIDKKSPLFLAIDFLINFIKELDYNSNFYYPLMCLDSGIFRCKYKKDKTYELTTYGLNMYNIETIKNHLFNLIPNLIIFSNYMNSDDYFYTYDGIGLVTLNNIKFGKDFGQKISAKNIRYHKSFILAKNLFHELMGHAKSSLGKDFNKFYSPVCFKDNIGTLRLLTNENNDNLFLNLYDINDLSKFIHKNSSGDSGYYLEYFFGMINNEYVLDILEDIEDNTNLGILLDVNLWHTNMSVFRTFVELKNYIVKNEIDQSKIDLDSDIIEQIKQMKNLIEAKGGLNQNINENINIGKDDDIIIIADDDLMPKTPYRRIKRKKI